MKTQNVLVMSTLLTAILAGCSGGGSSSAPPPSTSSSGSGSPTTTNTTTPSTTITTTPSTTITTTPSTTITTPSTSTPVVPTPTVYPATLSASASVGSIGTSWSLTWTAPSATSCNATSSAGNWVGPVATNGTVNLTSSAVSSADTYTLTCDVGTATTSIKILPQYTAIPDPVFAEALNAAGITVTNGQMLTSDALSFQKLIITSMSGFYGYTTSANGVYTTTSCTAATNATCYFDNNSVPDFNARVLVTNGYITDATGLESFVNLKTLRFEQQKVTSINVSTLTNLIMLSLWRNPLASIDVSNNLELLTLGLSETSLTSVDISKLTKMVEIDFQHNASVPYTTGHGTLVRGFASLDLSKNTALTRMYIDNNNLTTIDLSTQKTVLTEFWASGNKFTSLDFTGYSRVNFVILNNSPDLTYLNLNGINFNNSYFRLYTQNAPNLATIHVDASNLATYQSIVAFELANGRMPNGAAVWVDAALTFVAP